MRSLKKVKQQSSEVVLGYFFSGVAILVAIAALVWLILLFLANLIQTIVTLVVMAVIVGASYAAGVAYYNYKFKEKERGREPSSMGRGNAGH